MNKKTFTACFAAFALLSPQLFARVGETEAEVEARYGKPVSKGASQNIDPEYDAKRRESLRNMRHTIDNERLDFPENFRKDGSRIDFVGEDAMIHADSRLIFFNPGTSKWEDLRSNVIGRKPTNQDSDALKQLTVNARRHLRQRFYLLNDISISVVYLGGRSVSEAYHQKDVFFSNDVVNELIKKSFPDGVMDEEENAIRSQRLIRIRPPDSKEIRGCVVYLEGVLTVTAYPYFGFLKAMEVALQKNAEIKQKQKIDGF